MQISTQNGLAFLSMPKCGSTSIENSISKYCDISFEGNPRLKHLNAQTFNKFILPMHQELMPRVQIESFCLIRDPLDWISSWYRYRSRSELRKQFPERYTGGISYNDFVSEYMLEGQRKPFARLLSQYKFLSLESGEVEVDHIISMHKFDLVSDFLSKKFGRRIRIRRKNVSKKIALTLNPELEAQLRQHLARDIAIFEYVDSLGHYQRSIHGEELSTRLQEHL